MLFNINFLLIPNLIMKKGIWPDWLAYNVFSSRLFNCLYPCCHFSGIAVTGNMLYMFLLRNAASQFLLLYFYNISQCGQLCRGLFITCKDKTYFPLLVEHEIIFALAWRHAVNYQSVLHIQAHLGSILSKPCASAKG